MGLVLVDAEFHVLVELVLVNIIVCCLEMNMPLLLTNRSFMDSCLSAFSPWSHVPLCIVVSFLQGMQVLQARTLDLKEYAGTQIDRSGAPAILNYGARKKSAEGHGT